jgi:tetratricopeptide (TPR) repeat protein
MKLDPFSWVMHQTLGMVHYKARRYDRAADEQRRALDMAPGAGLARIYLARALLAEGHARQAAEVCEAATSPRPADIEALLAIAHFKLGQAERARAIIGPLLAQHPPPTGALARWYSASGNYPAALDTLERALRERADVISSLKVETLFDGLRKDPRFTALLEQTGAGP